MTDEDRSGWQCNYDCASHLSYIVQKVDLCLTELLESGWVLLVCDGEGSRVGRLKMFLLFGFQVYLNQVVLWKFQKKFRINTEMHQVYLPEVSSVQIFWIIFKWRKWQQRCLDSETVTWHDLRCGNSSSKETLENNFSSRRTLFWRSRCDLIPQTGEAGSEIAQTKGSPQDSFLTWTGNRILGQYVLWKRVFPQAPLMPSRGGQWTRELFSLAKFRASIVAAKKFTPWPSHGALGVNCWWEAMLAVFPFPFSQWASVRMCVRVPLSLYHCILGMLRG